MPRFRPLHAALVVLLSVTALTATAQEKKNPRDADLGKKETTQLDQRLAGDLSRKKEAGADAPALKYDQFRLGVEMQVASKRREQIRDLAKIIELSRDGGEKPGLHFRLGELYWEESKFFFIEANRQDDVLIAAMNRKDAAGQAAAKAEKQRLLGQSKGYGKLAVEQYTKIIQDYPKFDRTDEVLFFLGQYLMENGEDRKALVAYKRLVEKFPKSKYIPDAWLAFGEYYFNNSKGRRPELEKALEAYKKAAQFPESSVYAFAIYKQGWCYFNMGDYENAKDRFKTVVLYGELAGAAAVEKDGGKSGKSGLVREARADFVRSYARQGDVSSAREEFSRLTSVADERFTMQKQLGNLYYEDGKDREAAITYNALIKEKPLSPEAPGFQARIVDIVLRMGDKGKTVGQVRRLTKIITEVEAAKVVTTDKDKKALSEAKELAERTLSNLAVNWHNEGKKTRDEETFKHADSVYSDYLVLFPENAKAYDLRFFWAELLNDNLSNFDKAAEQYTHVVMQDAKAVDAKKKPGKWLTNAAYNTVLALDEVVKKAEAGGQVKTETGSDITKKVAFPAVKKQLLDACERYLKYVPQGDKRVEIAFKAANLYYRYNHFDEAVLRFSEIAMQHPEYKFENGERAAELAANLILDSYNLLGDYAKVNEWARRFYTNDKLASGKFRDELSRIIETSAFKLINQLEAKKEFARAAEAYLTFVADFPKSEIADTALYNASVDFYQAKMLDKSIEVRGRLIRQYPQSKYVPQCIYANAEALEAMARFDEAADTYELYVRGYERAHGGAKAAPARSAKARRAAKARSRGGRDEGEKKAVPQVFEEQKAQVALFNASTFREGLGEYRQALRLRERYLELWPKAKDAEQVFLSIADLWEKQGAYGKAMKHLEEYEREYLRFPSKVLAAEGRIARIYEEKQRRPRDANRIYNRIMDYYSKLGPRGRKELEKPALVAVGRAQFQAIEPDYAQFMRLRLSGGQYLPAFAERLKASVKDKRDALSIVQKQYVATVALGAPEPAICSLYRMGLMFDNFADRLVNVSVPTKDEELKAQVRDQFDQQAQPIKEMAAEAFTNAVAKARELDVYNDCSAKSLALLRSTYRPEQYPDVLERKLPLPRAADARVSGNGLLTGIQAVPVVAVAAAPAAADSQDIKKDLEALQRSLRNKPRESVEVEPESPRSAPAKADSKQKAESEEPEDVL